MSIDSINAFIEGLIEKTKKQQLEWKPLFSLPIWDEIKQELETEDHSIDFGFNSIRVSNSYYLKSGNGYIFLFEIYHGLPEITSPEMDTVALMVKINNYLPIENLTTFTEDEQEQLRTLQILIANNVDKDYSYQNLLDSFLADVLK